MHETRVARAGFADEARFAGIDFETGRFAGEAPEVLGARARRQNAVGLLRCGAVRALRVNPSIDSSGRLTRWMKLVIHAAIMRPVLLFASMLAFAACAGAADEADPAADPPRGPLGKADSTGTCEGTLCDGPSADGSCWCDDACIDYGDCCADRAAVCEADPADAQLLVDALLGVDDLSVGVTPSCGTDPRICCDEAGNVSSPCGPVDIDLEAPQLEVAPVGGQWRVDVLMRAKIATQMAIPVRYAGVECEVSFETGREDADSVELAVTAVSSQDSGSSAAPFEIETVDLRNFEPGDVVIDGSFPCRLAETFLPVTFDVVEDTIEDRVHSVLSAAL